MLVSNSDHVLAVEEHTESHRQRAAICCCCCCYLEVCGLRIGFLMDFDPLHTLSADCLYAVTRETQSGIFYHGSFSHPKPVCF